MDAKTRIMKPTLWVMGVIALIAALGAGWVFGVDAYVVHSTKNQILLPEEAAELTDVDCILVLGCAVCSGGKPSDMLEDRLKRGVALHDDGVSGKLLMTGDHGQTNYDEVRVMKQYAIDAGISSEDVFMDHAGFSTYESIYRAKEIFGADKIVIVTQQYHLYRALHIANALGMEAYGVDADYRRYSGQTARDLREILTRNKDFFLGIFQPEPTYLGERIPIFGNGNATNDYDFT